MKLLNLTNALRYTMELYCKHTCNTSITKRIDQVELNVKIE